MIRGIQFKDALALGELCVMGDAENARDALLETEIKDFTVDSRLIEQGSLFFALRGERVDGHDFIADVRDKGALAAVVEKQQQDVLPQICTEDTQRALARFAAIVRQNFSGAVIGITGSSGKTTIKNMAKSVLAQSGVVSATPGNLNNEIGVPLSIANIEPNADFAVLEMGAAQSGDIAYLCEIAKPNIALISNVGHAHVGRFGSIENTAKTKGEIYSDLHAGDTAIVNLDDCFADFWLSSLLDRVDSPQVLTFSLEKNQASVSLVRPEDTKEQPTIIKVLVRRPFEGKNDSESQAESILQIRRQLPGKHNIANALATIAIAVAAGLDNNQIEQGFSADLNVDTGRLVLRQAQAGFDLIDDTYNANPESLCAAIDYLGDYSKKNEKKALLALGDMAELGDQSAEYHREVGAYAAKAGVDQLYCCGSYADDYAMGFSENARSQQSVSVSIDQQAMVDALQEKLSPDSVVLIKGSRSSAMEKVVQALDAIQSEVASC